MSDDNRFINSAEPDVTVDILDNGTVIGQSSVIDGRWTFRVSALATGNHMLTAQLGALGSTERFLRVTFDEITDFDDGTFGGWEDMTPDREDLSLVTIEGEAGLCVYNHTFTNRSNGVVLQKTFTGLSADKIYLFSIRIQRSNTASWAPEIFLTANDVPISPTVIPVFGTWTDVAGVTHKGQTEIRFAVNNAQATSHGNDYWMDDFRVREI